MLKTVDLFAGAGGLSYGFLSTGEFNIVAAAENNPNARKTYIANHKGNVLMIDDVRGYDFRALNELYGGIDIVIGGPPCQGFSNANRQKNHIISMNNSLVKEYFRAVKEINPMAFVMENVSMLSSDTHRFYDSYIDHDEVSALDVQMDNDDLIISEGNYDSIDCFQALQSETSDFYRISDALLQLLNVLYKNRSNTGRLSKYINKNSREIKKQISNYFESGKYDFKILHNIDNSIETVNLADHFDDLGLFLKFQKSFRLKGELDENQIIYTLHRSDSDERIIAKVQSYAVIEYVNKILGDEYVKKSGVVSALWFGVPQDRKRFIMMGIRQDVIGDRDICFPEGPEEDSDIITVGDAIMDLSAYRVHDDPSEDELEAYNDHTDVSEYAKAMRTDSDGVINNIVPKTRAKALERFANLNEGENFHKLSGELKDNYADPSRTQNSIYLRLDRSKPSGTVVNVRKSMWVHPTLDRAISVREAARLQSFPDRFVFKGTKDSMYQQVGNAVPPLMAKGIADALLKCINQLSEK